MQCSRKSVNDFKGITPLMLPHSINEKVAQSDAESARQRILRPGFGDVPGCSLIALVKS